MTGGAHRSPSTKRVWFHRPWRRYGRGLVRRGLDGVHVSGLDHLRRAAAAGPIVVASNHVAWWDAFMLLLLEQAVDADGYCLMDAANMRRLPFFGWFGAVPLDRSTPARAAGDLVRAATLLDRPGRMLWIFPQGRQQPAHLRPLGCRPGVSRLAALARAPVVPVGLQYAFVEAPRPRAFLSIGVPLPPDVAATGPDRVEVAIGEALDRVDAHLRAPADAFAPLVGGRGRDPGTGLGARALALLGRGS